MRDPFTVLGVTEDDDDGEIRRRYLALVREFPPDQASERFQALRAAYDALSDERKRLETTLLHTNSAAFTRLSMGALRAASEPAQSGAQAPHATRQTVAALLAKGIARALPNPSGEGHGSQGGQ
jgi:curved DNA-binding protein CbpA